MNLKELNEWEDRCTQEAAPRCRAACPLHLDVRGFCAHMARRHWDKAWSLLARSLPLPGLMARLCDAPCQADCLRRDLGGALAVAGLERFCASMARPAGPPRPMPSRHFRVAVLGGGVSGLCAAWELARRGFEVSLHRTAPVGIPADFPAAILEGELENLERLGVILAPAPDPDPELPEALLREVRAVFVDGDALPELLHGRGEPDAATCATSQTGLFACRPGESSFALRAAVGRRLTISVERFMQGIPLGMAREGEGPYRTRLVTDVSGVAPIPAIAPEAGFTEATAGAEAGRCLDCQCLTCVKHCVFLEHYKSYPKAYARQIYNNSSNVVGLRQANTMINSCTLCGLCEELCPGRFSMAAVCLDARRVMVAQDRMPPSAHEFALRDMAFANGERCALARHAPGTTISRYLFFPGCQLTACDPDGVAAAYDDLCRRLGGVGLLLSCCGAPARWSGRDALFQTSMAALGERWRALGRPALIVACPSCAVTLADGLPEAPRISYWSLLRTIGLPPGAAEAGGIGLAVNDPCAARHCEALRQDVRTLLGQCGVSPVEPARTGRTTECCGYGGLSAEANPELGSRVAKHRAEAASEDFVTYCAMCREQLAKAGKRALHLFDLLFPREDDPAARPVTGYSQRRENRARLKERLLDDVWRDPMAKLREAFEAIPIVVTDEAARRMEERRILASDIAKVLRQAEETGRRFVHAESGHFLASYQPSFVTYWVEYGVTPAGYLVYNVWSHRLRITGGQA
uniref:NADPH-dependent glutamate synthase beta chain-like oxidoreductase n=1 Tax=Desulfovibrio sp. U5L TaxID=596152 RepID=I2PWN8_9BACT